MTHNHSYKVSIKKLPGSKVEIEGEIPAAEFTENITAVLKEALREAEVKGFRKGAAPEKIVREMLGESLLNDAARETISHAYGHIIEAEKIDAIGYPEISITKIAENNPLGFKLTTAVVPEIKNLDYKTIAGKENKKEKTKVEVGEKEFNETLKTLLENYAKAVKPASPETASRGGLEKAPELTDELVKKFGEFSNVEDFKKKLRENIISEKEQKENEKRRIALIDAMVSEIKIEIPDVLIEHELDRMISEMKNDVERMGFTWSDYLKHNKKTDDGLKKEWRKAAEKRVILDLAIEYIAKTEKISADEKKVAAEIEHTKEHHKDIDIDRAKSYFEQVYRTQAVFEFLEKQK